MIKQLVMCALFLGGSFANAADGCIEQLKFDYSCGNDSVDMCLHITNEAVVEELVRIMPYGDCYQGICSAYYSVPSKNFVINFSTRLTNGYYEIGKVAQYSTIGSDNTVYLSVETNRESKIFEFKDCHD